MVCFDYLNPIGNAFIMATTDVVELDFEENLFSARASIEESFLTLVIKKKSLFRKFFIHSFTCAYPLSWWHICEGQFLNVGFLAK
jgi:hypothetical protein